MKKTLIESCPVCMSFDSIHYMTTKALMHQKNNERFTFNKCLQCDTVFLTNPVEEFLLKAYYTNNYLPYRGDSAWGKYRSFVAKSQEKLDLKRLKIVSPFIENQKTFSILDVGCGNPSFLNTLQQKFNASCTGIDFSDDGWKDKNFKNISLIKTSINDFSPKIKFDVITLWHYLEHDYNLQATVDKLFHCLNANGKLIIEVPDHKSLTAKRQKQFWQGWHSPRHLTLFSENSFQTLFKNDKWSFLKYTRYGTLDAFTLWWLGKMEKKNTDWSGSMEGEFWPLVFLKIVSFPVFLFERVIPMGIQVLVLQKK